MLTLAVVSVVPFGILSVPVSHSQLSWLFHAFTSEKYLVLLRRVVRTLSPVSVGSCTHVGVVTVGTGTVARVARSVGNFVVVTVVVGAKAFTISSMSNENVGRSVGASHLSACTTALDDITLTSSCAGDVVVRAFDDGFAMELKSESRVSSLDVAGIDSPCRRGGDGRLLERSSIGVGGVGLT